MERKNLYKLILAVEMIAVGLGGGLFIRFSSESKKILLENAGSSRNEAAILKIAAIVDIVGDVYTNKYCDQAFFTNLDATDKKFCARQTKLTKSGGIEVDLTNGKAMLYENGTLVKIFPLSYQAPENKWYQSPTGYYSIGVKKESHLSSIFPVKMPYAVQYYEDFFLHGIPFFENGAKVSSEFTGGCLRFEDKVAGEIYNFLKTGDQIAVYKTFDDLEIKPELNPHVKLENFWIRQRFNNPYRSFWAHSGDIETLKEDYYMHTGVDFAPDLHSNDLLVYAIYDGEVSKIQNNDGKDHGLGNTIILKHKIGKDLIYSSYSHLDSIKENLEEGSLIKKGETIGVVGNSGQGCKNYWRIGFEGCKSDSPFDTHLHLEIKTAPVLENPIGGEICKRQNNTNRPCYGYTPDYPTFYGYLNPLEFLFRKNGSKI